jgi:molybdopterin-containing oxidoreductase family membrane subunit
MSDTRQLLGRFDHADRAIESVRALQEKKIPITDVFSPVANETLYELVAGKGKSPVRYLTFIGALVGLVSGFALALLTSQLWEMVVGGKPVYSVMPFVVVGFELMILFGAIATLIGVLLFSGLPYRKFPGKAYRPEFSDDEFGVHVSPPADRVEETRAILAKAGALDIQDLDTVGATR